MAFAAAAFGKRFWYYTIATAAVSLLFGSAKALHPEWQNVKIGVSRRPASQRSRTESMADRSARTRALPGFAFVHTAQRVTGGSGAAYRQRLLEYAAAVAAAARECRIPRMDAFDHASEAVRRTQAPRPLA